MQPAAIQHAMHGGDVRVLESRARARLSPKALHHASVLREDGRHDLDGHLAIESDVASQIYGRHSAAAQLSIDFEFAERRRLKPLEDARPRGQRFGIRLLRRQRRRDRSRIDGHAAGRARCIARNERLTALLAGIDDRAARAAEGKPRVQRIFTDAADGDYRGGAGRL
jgi:hypothetical protein